MHEYVLIWIEIILFLHENSVGEIELLYIDEIIAIGGSVVVGQGNKMAACNVVFFSMVACFANFMLQKSQCRYDLTNLLQIAFRTFSLIVVPSHGFPV